MPPCFKRRKETPDWLTPQFFLLISSRAFSAPVSAHTP